MWAEAICLAARQISIHLAAGRMLVRPVAGQLTHFPGQSVNKLFAQLTVVATRPPNSS